MNKNAKWIWLDETEYPSFQKSAISVFDNNINELKYAAVEFRKKTEFGNEISAVKINISADVVYSLYVNGSFIGNGPACAGGDYGIDFPMPYHYYDTYAPEVSGDYIEFYVVVQNLPRYQCEMSQGKNGMILSATVTLKNGEEHEIITDSSWNVRIDNRVIERDKVDFTLPRLPWSLASEAENIWNLKKTPIPPMAEEEVFPYDFEPFTVQPCEMVQKTFYFDKIYSIYHHIKISGNSNFSLMISDFEKDIAKTPWISEDIRANGNLDFRGNHMVSAGGIRVFIYNGGNTPLTVDGISGYFVHYPVSDEGDFECSVECFNKIYKMGKHALKICRQTLELDSPMHQENLGCSGDYMIASLMNYYIFGDARLTRFDIVRIADYLKISDGFMFHTSYSMMWTMMIYDYYMYTGDKSLVEEVADSVEILFEKMHSYTNENGLIDNPPSYMFLDWLELDGFSIHHPPMALGQASLNAFYCGGLDTAVKLFEILGMEEICEKLKQRAVKLRAAFEVFYDSEKGLYCDGLNSKYEPKEWIPENTDKKYFSWHTNTLAVLYNLAPESEHKRIMETILSDMTIMNPQPYFMHFVLEAIYKCGLFESHGINQLMRWKEMTAFEKGLQEGWYDISGYGFDYSHVWAGTPSYQLPSKLSGLEMTEPGFKKIKLNPQLFGLEFAKIKIPTPYGYINISMKQGEEAIVDIPEGIEMIDSMTA